jgi:hypothetical protein
MPGMRLCFTLVLITVLPAGACSGRTTQTFAEGGAGGAGSALSCPPLEQADAGDAGSESAGCLPGPTAMICTSGDCHPLCPAGDYEMTCRGAGPMGPIPGPPSGLGCSITPIPTPSNVLFYCCPCAP